MHITDNVMQERYLVINADDFGLSSKVNEGIMRAHERGCLRSTSLMANGPLFEQAVEMSRSVPRLDVGVHLNLVRGKPISKAAAVKRLIDERGLFPGTIGATMRRLMQSPIALDQAEGECCAQVEHIMQAGIHPTHIDSEKHLHMYPPLFRRVVRTAIVYGIRWIRIVEENRIPWRTKPAMKQVGKAFVLRLFARSCRKRAAENGLMYSDLFYGVLHAGHMVKEVYDDILERIRPGVTEIVCHPGLSGESNTNSDLGPYFLATDRQDELDALLDESLPSKLQSRKVKLVGFGDLR